MLVTCSAAAWLMVQTRGRTAPRFAEYNESLPDYPRITKWERQISEREQQKVTRSTRQRPTPCGGVFCGETREAIVGPQTWLKVTHIRSGSVMICIRIRSDYSITVTDN